MLRPRLPRPAVTLRYVPGWGAGGSPAAQGIARADVLDLRARPVVMIRVLTSRIVPPGAVPVSSSSLVDVVCRHLDAAGVARGPDGAQLMLPDAVAARLRDQRRPQGVRHGLASLVSVLVAGVACGHRSPLAIAQAAAGWGQEVLAGHGCRISPVTGRRVPPSASTLDRLGDHLDPDELEAALTGLVAGAALDPAAQSRAAAARAAARQHTAARRRRPHAADALRETRAGGWFRAAPGHPWLDPAVTGDPGHVPARVAVAVDGKERKLAKAGGKKKVHLLGAVTHVTGLVIGQDKVAKSGKANEVTHFKPLLEPLPLRGAVVTADAMQATRDNARYAREVKHAHFLWPVLGNQPGMYAALDALDWENTSVAAATSEITRGRVETRTIRVLPVPDGLDFPYAEQAILIERYVTVRKNGRWVMRNCEAVLYVTSLAAEASTPRDLLAHVRGHWTVEHLHWLRSMRVPGLLHDVALKRFTGSFCNTFAMCGACCRRCSERCPSRTCNICNTLNRRRRRTHPTPTCTFRQDATYARFAPRGNRGDVIWKEDKSLIRTGNRPQVMSAIVNLVITLFRIRGVTRYAEETRRNAQDPRRALQMLDLLAPSPG